MTLGKRHEICNALTFSYRIHHERKEHIKLKDVVLQRNKTSMNQFDPTILQTHYI